MCTSVKLPPSRLGTFSFQKEFVLIKPFIKNHKDHRTEMTDIYKSDILGKSLLKKN